MNKALKTLAAAIAVALAGAAVAGAPGDGNTLRAQVAKSDLVFVGTVVEVAYAPSTDLRNGRGIPHTFVTYEVEEVLQGAAEDKHITLRFIGGRGEEAAFLAVSDMPMFDKGDRDVMMVSANGTSGCPLVDCSDGRLRLINDMVFSEEGQAIESDGKGGVLKTAFYDLPEVMTHVVSQTTMHRVDQLDAGESRNTFDATADRGAHMGATALIGQLKEDARAVGRATPATFRSADIAAPFSIVIEAEAAPSEAPAKQADNAPAKSAQDLAEEAAFAANGRDPVLHNMNEKR